MANPDIKFLLSHPANFFALGFGSGLAPKAPGTVGTLVGFPLYCALILLPPMWHLPIVAGLFIIGIPICSIASKNLGIADHAAIVWDEMVAMMLVLTFTPLHWFWWFAAFLLFRLFDIWKPYPICYADAKLKNGFGVMFDDLLAAIYAIFVMKFIVWAVSQL